MSQSEPPLYAEPGMEYIEGEHLPGCLVHVTNALGGSLTCDGCVLKAPPFVAGHGRPDLDVLYQVVAWCGMDYPVAEIRDNVVRYLYRRPNDLPKEGA